MRTRTVVIGVVGFIAAATAFVACSDTVIPPAADSLSPSLAKGGAPKSVKSVSVAPSAATVAMNASLQLTASASPAGSATTFTWTSSNPAVATVSNRRVGHGGDGWQRIHQCD